MAKVGIPPEQREAVLACVAAVLHLGNVAFTEGKEVESSMVAPGGAAEESLKAAGAAARGWGLFSLVTHRKQQLITEGCTSLTPHSPLPQPPRSRAAGRPPQQPGARPHDAHAPDTRGAHHQPAQRARRHGEQGLAGKGHLLQDV
jgi:hypothetical protein